MTVDTSVKFMHADMVGAPVLAGVAGSLINVLDAFLVNGFGVKAVDSGTISNGVCRLAFSGASCADNNAVIWVGGATPAGLNGAQKVTNFSSAWVEFATTLPDGPVSGSVTFKLAPLGWEKVFSKTNVAVYRPTDPAGTRPYLRMDDTGTSAARVTMYESMTDVDTGLNPCPSAATIAGGYYWWKKTVASALGVPYFLAGDGQGLFFGAMASQLVGAMGSSGFIACYAGDLKSYRSGDAFCGFVTGGTSTSMSAVNVQGGIFSVESETTRSVMRRANGIGSSQTCDRTAHGATFSGNNGPLGPAPASVNNGLFMTPIVVSDGGTLATNGPRGEIPGALCSIQSGLLGVVGQGLGQISGTGVYAGKTLLRMQVATRPDGAGSMGTGFIDITGPWREV